MREASENMDELYDMLQDVRTDRDVIQTEDYESFDKQYAAFFPLLAKLEGRIFRNARFFVKVSDNTIRNESRPEIRKELEYCALPFYSASSIPQGLIECRRIVSWMWGIEAEISPIRLYYSKYDEDDPGQPPTRTFYKTYDCWLSSKTPITTESRRDLKSFGFKMNCEELLDILDLSELPTEPVFVYVQMEDLKKLGVEPPPKPEQEAEDKIACDAYGRSVG